MINLKGTSIHFSIDSLRLYYSQKYLLNCCIQNFQGYAVQTIGMKKKKMHLTIKKGISTFLPLASSTPPPPPPGSCLNSQY